MAVQIKKHGKKMTIEIPARIVNLLDLADGMSLDATTLNGSLVLSKRNSRRTIQVGAGRLESPTFRKCNCDPENLSLDPMKLVWDDD